MENRLPKHEAHNFDPKEEFDETFLALKQEIRSMAKQSRRHKSLKMATTELVNETYLKLLPSLKGRNLDRLHFLGVAGRAIRSILSDLARANSARKRGADVVLVTLNDVASLAYPIEKQLDLDRKLKQLREQDAELADIIDRRFFGGCTDEELSQFFNFSIATAQRRVRNAIAFLQLALHDDKAPR